MNINQFAINLNESQWMESNLNECQFISMNKKEVELNANGF